MSGGRRAPSLRVGAAVTSRAAAAALGGGEQLEPPPRPPLSFLSARLPSHFPRVLPRPRAAGGGGGRSCHGHQLGAAPAGGSCCSSASSAPFPSCPALVSADGASIRGGCGRLAAARPAWDRRPRPGAPRCRRRREGEPEVGAGAPRPGELGDLGKPAYLFESRLPGLRNGDDHGVPFRKRSLRRRSY